MANRKVDICSLEVLLLFTENFDYQDTRMDFLKGVLESDILNKNIYAHIINVLRSLSYIL